MPGLLEQLDGAISDLFQGWNVYSTVLVVGLLAFVGWVVANNADADTHPLLLARQAQASYVRQPGESAVFRCPETPHGCTSPPLACLNAWPSTAQHSTALLSTA